MTTENIVWAFSSEQHRCLVKEGAVINNNPLPKETYYKDTNGKWVRATAVFDCIDIARKNYRYGDIKYLGAVDATTKVEVDYGVAYPPSEPKSVMVEKAIKKKKIKTPGNPGTISVKNNIAFDFPSRYGVRPLTGNGDYWM